MAPTASQVRLSRDTIGILVAETSEFIELTQHGKLIARSKLDFPESAHLIRFAMSRSGRVLFGGGGMPSLLEWNREKHILEERPEWQGTLLGIEDGKLVLANYVFGSHTELRFYDIE